MNDDLAAFARLIEVVRPWSKDLVVVGGWAHWLYRLHDTSNVPSYQALQTRDADLAFSLKAPPDGDIGTALKRAGFHERRSGEHVPPVTRYQLGEGDLGFYAEFLVPLYGSATKRDGSPDATVAASGVFSCLGRHSFTAFKAGKSLIDFGKFLVDLSEFPYRFERRGSIAERRARHRDG